MNAQTRYLFEVLKAKRVEIRCDERNAASLAIMKKLGLNIEAVFKNDEVNIHGDLSSTVVSARFDSEGLPEVPGLSW